MITIKWSQERQARMWGGRILFFCFASVFSLRWVFPSVLSLSVTFSLDLAFLPVDLGFDSGSESAVDPELRSPLIVAKPLWTGHVRGRLGEMAHGSSLRADKGVPERKRVRLNAKDSMNVEQYFELLGGRS
jgi:hypothetical protein